MMRKAGNYRVSKIKIREGRVTLRKSIIQTILVLACDQERATVKDSWMGDKLGSAE
jgi:hypothetical protein